MMIRLSILLVALSLSIGTSRGQTLAAYAGEFLSIGAGARSLALGGAYTALASDASGSYWNPAALGLMTVTDVMLMHEERFAGLLNYDIAAAAIPSSESSTLGISLLRLGVDGIPDSRNAHVDLNGNGELDAGELDHGRITYFNAADWALFVSYGMKASDRLTYGFTAKVLRRSIAEFSATGLGFDAGILYRPTDNILLGATAQDVTTTFLAWSTGRTELISPTLRTGAAVILTTGSFRVIPTVECAIRAENRGAISAISIGPVSLDPAAGVELEYNGTFALRAGLSEVGAAAIGAGMKIRKLDIDYAYTGFKGTSELGSSHRISLRMRIES